MQLDDDPFAAFARRSLVSWDTGASRRIPTPYDAALRSLVDVRRALDRLEESLVDGARRFGATWEEIGHELSVSRQAVHRRHARHDPVTAGRTARGIAEID